MTKLRFKTEQLDTYNQVVITIAIKVSMVIIY